MPQPSQAALTPATLRDIAEVFDIHIAKLREHHRKHEQTDEKLMEVEGYIAILDRHRQSIEERIDAQADATRALVRREFEALVKELRGLGRNGSR